MMKRRRRTPSDANARSTSLAGVVLCGGRGSRMGRTATHKVCADLAGRPAVVRLIETLRDDGVWPIVVVVGHRANDVIETVGRYCRDVLFAYQRQPLGTGDAAKVGIEALHGSGYRGDVVVTMGDKWLRPGLVREVAASKRTAGLLVVSTPKHRASTGGRLVRGARGRIVANVELRDIQRARILEAWRRLAAGQGDIPTSRLRAIGRRHIKPDTKLWRALGPLATWARARGHVDRIALVRAIEDAGTGIRVGDHELSADQVERRSASTNESLYVGDIATLRAAVLRLRRDNAQDEYYLTDIVSILASDRRNVVAHHVREAHDIMAFNTLDELSRIARHVQRMETGRSQAALRRIEKRYARRPAAWQRWLSSVGRSPRKMARIYGVADGWSRENVRALHDVVRLFARSFGEDRPVFLIRAPGRVNLMGRHIDHQGGFVHVMATNREVVFAAAPRDDDVVRLVNADADAFPRREHVLGDWRASCASGDWRSFVDSEIVASFLDANRGDWSSYVLAAALFLQHRDPKRRLCGADIAVVGNIPMGAGLSSSSALVVAAMEALLACNAITAPPRQIVDWCGQAEWFVGSRGGHADHAAIRLARAGQAARVGFFPFRIADYVPIPADAAILIADSGERAIKSRGAKDRFNERVANYRLGMLLLQQQFLRHAKRLERVADILHVARRAGAPTVDAMLAALPERITQRGLQQRLSRKHAAQLDGIFASHRDPGAYTIRAVVEYGVAECARSERAMRLLGSRDLVGFGRMMNRSHDGDRVTTRPAEAPPPLHERVGAYGCSTEAIDEMVDIATSVSGVYGAQIAGAGLGGSAMILADPRAVRRVRRALVEQFYRPRGRTPGVWRVWAVAGGGLIAPS